jgi:hypothetical protein
MMRALRRFSILCAACIVGASQAEPAGQNSTTVVIAAGPFAGSYTIDNGGCVYIKDRDILGVTFKQFAHTPKTKTLEEAAIEVDRASTPGAKTGDVTVEFLDVASDKPQDFSVSNVPLTVIRNGKRAQFSFEGQSRDHVPMRVTATCDHTDEY